jgi:hypothetical protein
MPSPFPGMDLYLEGRGVWPDVHHSLIVAMRRALAPQVAPGYFIAIEQRTYLIALEREEFVGRPDVAVVATSPESMSARGAGTATAVASAAQTVSLPDYERIEEGYLEIRDARTQRVVTVIELLSPTNKLPGEGRQEYEAKRRQVLKARTSLVEIDLLRAGPPMEMLPQPRSDYRILVACGWEHPEARLFSFGVRDPLPVVPVPLRQEEREATLALEPLLTEVYDEARYDLRLDYAVPPPEPPLSPEDTAWVDDLLRARGLRA